MINFSVDDILNLPDNKKRETLEKLLSEVKNLRGKDKYGLYWDLNATTEGEENVIKECQTFFPVLDAIEDGKGLKHLTQFAPQQSDLFDNPNKPQPTHLLIEGDNYHALNALLYTHRKAVDLIYIDPPYNTGEKDFRYNDNFVDKENGDRHTLWLSFMKTRLELGKELLKDTGVIAIHIDENEFDDLNLLLKKHIFSEECYLGFIVWNKKNPKGDAGGVATMHEYIACYAKNKEKFLKLANPLKRKKPNAIEILNKAKRLFSKIGKNDIPEEIREVIKAFNFSGTILKEFRVKYDLELVNKEFQTWLQRQDFSGGEKAYKFIDEKGKVYQSVSMAWPNKKQAPEDYFIPLYHPVTALPCPIPERGWRNPPDTMKKLLNSNLILFGENEITQPRRNIF